MKYCLSLIIFLVLTLSAYGQNHLLDRPNEIPITLITYQKSMLDIESIRRKNDGWKESNLEALNLGFSEQGYWFKFNFNNMTINTQWFLTIDNTRLDFVDFHLFTQSDERSFYTGDHRSIEENISSYPTFNFELLHNQKAELYVYIKSSARIEFKPTIRSSFTYGEYKAQRQFFHFIYLTIFIIFLSYLLMVNNDRFKSVKRYYCGCLFFGFSYIFCYFGEANLMLWPNSIYLKNVMIFILSSAGLLCYVLFIRQYLRSEIKTFYLNKFIILYAIIFGICTIITMLPVSNFIRVCLLFFQVNLTVLILIFSTASFVKSNFRWKPLMALPLIFSTLAIVVFELTFLNILPANKFMSKIILWSLPADFVLISLSFVIGHFSLKKSNENLKSKLIEYENIKPPTTINKNEVNNSVNSRLNNVDSEVILVRLTSYLKQERAFLEPGLTLDEVADNLNIRADQLSAIINSELNTSFSSLINFQRLEAAATLLTLNTRNTILDIALECGFGSKSSFNRLFKLHFDLTPSQYRKEFSQKE